MNKISPIIHSGGRRLVLSETVYFPARSGVMFGIPTTDPVSHQPGPPINFRFEFPYGVGMTSSLEKGNDEKGAFVRISDVRSPMPSGVTQALELTIGDKIYSAFFICTGLGNAPDFHIQLTLSIYEGAL